MTGLRQLIPCQPVRRRKEERLALGVHGNSCAFVRQGFSPESLRTTRHVCAGWKRNVLCFVERHNRQFVKLQGFRPRFSHNVSFVWWVIFISNSSTTPFNELFYRSQKSNWIQLRFERVCNWTLADGGALGEQPREHCFVIARSQKAKQEALQADGITTKISDIAPMSVLARDQSHSLRHAALLQLASFCVVLVEKIQWLLMRDLLYINYKLRQKMRWFKYTFHSLMHMKCLNLSSQTR